MKPSFSFTAQSNLAHTNDSIDTQKKSVKEKAVTALAFTIRILSVAPVFAALLITLMWVHDRALIGSVANLIVSYGLLVGMPLVSYPVHAAIPFLRKKGRKCQRSLAIVFSVISYVSGVVYCVVAKAPAPILAIFITYLISGALIAFFTFVMKFKASGHASGIAGPISALIVFASPWYVLAYLFVLPVMWCTLRTGRHTVVEFLVGCLCPVVALTIALFITGIV